MPSGAYACVPGGGNLCAVLEPGFFGHILRTGWFAYEVGRHIEAFRGDETQTV